MALFRKKDSAAIVRRGSTGSETETRKTKQVGGDTVEIRRVTSQPAETQKPQKGKPQNRKGQNRSGQNR